MSESTFRRIKDFLFGEEPAEKGGQRKARAAERPPTLTKLPPAHSPLPATMQAGTLQMVGLQSVREILGEKWDARRDAIHRTVEGVIRRRIETVDAYYRVADDQYLILFVRLDHWEAEGKAKGIADEVRRLIVGELPPGCEIQVTSSIAEVDRNFLMNEVQTLDELLHYVKSGATAATDEEDITFFGAVEPDVLGATASAPAMGEGPDLTDLDQSLTALFQKKSSAAFLKECKAAFHPAFSVKRRSFSFFSVAVMHLPTQQPVEEVEDPLIENAQELQFLLDRYALTTALLGLHQMVTGGMSGIITIPVSLQTLVTVKLRNLYLSRLKEIPSGFNRYLCALIGCIPEGTPASRVAQAVTVIQPFCASRVISIPPDPRLMDLYATAGAHGFATRLSPDSGDIGKRYQILSAFANRAAFHKSESILDGISDRDDLHAAAAAGFTFMSGDAIAPKVDIPGGRDLETGHIPVKGDATPVVFPKEKGYRSV